jgi:hypothetical protein
MLGKLLRPIDKRTKLGELRTMDWKPIEPPDSVSPLFRKTGAVIIRHEERVLAVFAEGAEGVLEVFAALFALNGKMAHG